MSEINIMKKFGKKITTISLSLGIFAVLPAYITLISSANLLGETILLISSLIAMVGSIVMLVGIVCGLALWLIGFIAGKFRANGPQQQNVGIA